MSNEAVVNERVRYVTKPLKEKVNEYLQLYLWKEVVDKLKIKEDQLIEINLSACPVGEKQRICIADTFGKNVDDEQCIYIGDRCATDIYVVYDADNNSETMLLKEEFADKAE